MVANLLAVEAVAGVVRERTGLVFPPSRRDGVALAVHRAMARAGLADPERYRDLIATDGRALDDLVAELTIGETYFFRELAQFDWLRSEALPAIRRSRGPGHPIRAWSSGCASGEEAYSLAIVFDQEGLGDETTILATDISRAALAKARTGVYGPWSFRATSADRLSPYVRQEGQGYVVEEWIRRRVHFAYLNLALDQYPALTNGTWEMDLILCRNVLIYLDPATVAAVARRLRDCLAPGGWLLTASTDPPLGREFSLEAVSTPAGIVYRRPTESVRPASETEEAPGALFGVREFIPALGRFIQSGDKSPHSQKPTSCDVEARDVRSLANVDVGRAVEHCAAAVARHPLSAELHYLHAVLLLDRGRYEEAIRAARRVLYLDRTLAVGHFVLGSICHRRGDRQAARRAYRNARDLCLARPADEIVPLADGERAGRLAEAAADQLAVLEATGEDGP